MNPKIAKAIEITANLTKCINEENSRLRDEIERKSAELALLKQLVEILQQQ